MFHVNLLCLSTHLVILCMLLYHVLKNTICGTEFNLPLLAESINPVEMSDDIDVLTTTNLVGVLLWSTCLTVIFGLYNMLYPNSQEYFFRTVFWGITTITCWMIYHMSFNWQLLILMPISLRVITSLYIIVRFLTLYDHTIQIQRTMSIMTSILLYGHLKYHDLI